jgi:hypothetical protein
VVEYADVVWDNCTHAEKTSLEKIQYEAARVVTGCTKLVSVNKLLSEAGWEALEERRSKHKLILFFKMVKGLAPEYLSSMVPQSVGDISTYQLRNSSNLSNIPHRTSLYASSFLPSTINLWNSLPNEIKELDSLTAFKSYINRNKPKSNKLFYHGKRRLQILHTRLRTSCSSLNHHLFSKNIVASPLCSCGLQETTAHYFMKCSLYDNIRDDLVETLNLHGKFDLKTILFGNDVVNFDTNVKIFDAVHRFIDLSGRF